MSKWALNTQKGSVINHPSAGKFVGGIAREVSFEEANQLKHIINMVLLDGFDEPKKVKD